jgi:hypothetical protein
MKEQSLMEHSLQRGTLTPLGEIVTVQIIDEGVYWITTREHGGYLIDQALAQQQLTAHACAIGDRTDEEWLCFEEDCAWAVVVYEHPEWAIQPLQSTHVNMLLQQEYPDYLRARGERIAER